ncbi:MAG: Gfo/Idh/MocA family oxidoreductase [Oscillospiraceae bacterium]
MEVIKVAIVGLGGRGHDVYGQYIAEHQDKIQVVAIADIRRDRLEICKREWNLSEEMCFNSAEELFEQANLAQAVLICTPDKLHVAHAKSALEKDYHILLEKPISDSIVECQELLALAKKSHKHIVVCHILRYTPFYQTIKRMLDEQTIGEIVSVQAIENVAYWHQAHSYVRGNWRRKDESSPMILAKCSHDIDILLWLADKKCKRVSSYGDLYLFKKEKAPAGCGKRCTECSIRKDCPYDAVDFYLENPKTGVLGGHTAWPINILAPNPTEQTIQEALKNGPYGRCVYHCDNDVVDHQILNMQLEENTTISFTMCAFTDKCYRHIKIMGTQGYIEGDMDTNIITYAKFGEKRQSIDIACEGLNLAGHGGGDFVMMDKFVNLLSGDEEAQIVTEIEKSIDSHIVALLAEESRLLNGESICVEY